MVKLFTSGARGAERSSFVNNWQIWVWAARHDTTRHDTPPWRFWRAFIRATTGLIDKRSFWWVAASLIPWMEPTSIHLGSHCCDTWHVWSEGCKNWPLRYNPGMDWPIVTKFGVFLDTKPRCILHRSWMGYICKCARADAPPFPYLGNGWTDSVEIWYVVRDLLASASPPGGCGGRVPRFEILGNVSPEIAFFTENFRNICWNF